MKPSSRALAAAAIVAVILAGCVSSPDEVASSNSAEAPLAPGSLAGLVTDDELRPLEGVRVRVNETTLETVSGPAGEYRLDAIPPGTWMVTAEAALYETAIVPLDLEPSEEAGVDLRLSRGPDLRPHNRTATYQGHYDCAHEIPIWTGDCMILYTAATNQSDPYTKETFAFGHDVGPRWESVVVELTWTAGANNQLDGMRVYLENGNGTEVGHSYKVGSAEGPESPLRFVVHRGEPHPRADTYDGTSTKAFIPDPGERAQVRVFPRGKFYDQTSQVCSDDGCFLGVGVGLQIDFTVSATVFYNDRAPEGFTAVPA